MFSAIGVLFRAFFNICLLRTGPQDLPRSNELLIVCLFIYSVINTVFFLLSESFMDAVLAGVIESFLLVLITVAVLKINNTSQRWVQTVTALSGTGCLMALLALPVYYGITLDNLAVTYHAALLTLYIALAMWNISIMGHILRHAMDSVFGFGIVIAFVYIIMSAMTIALLLPEQTIS